jgi:hypothetical protein
MLSAYLLGRIRLDHDTVSVTATVYDVLNNFSLLVIMCRALLESRNLSTIADPPPR